MFVKVLQGRCYDVIWRSLLEVLRKEAKTYIRCSNGRYGRNFNNNNNINLFIAIGLLPGGSGYFTRKQNMKLVTTKFKLGGLHEKHVVATWNLRNHLSIYF